MKKPGEFLSKKGYFKERQELYDKMKSVLVEDTIVDIEGDRFQNSKPEEATHIFIWFDRKPFIANYADRYGKYMIGDQTMKIRNRKSSRVIAYVEQI